MGPVTEQQLKKIKEIEFSVSRRLFMICALVTVITMAMIILEFFSRGVFPPANIGLFYIGVLFIYSFHKEVLRWLEEKDIERRGEYFLYSWIVLATVLFIVNFFSNNYFSYKPNGVPTEVLKDISLITIEVGGIFLFTRVSKIAKIVFAKK